ncbi:MAG: Nif3-like dinuclear metal center hexameric protein [Leeuwenhoekiella sp.]
MTIGEVAQMLENFAPLANAEDFDNVGLLVGQPGWQLSGVLVALDTVEAVVDEAIEKQCNLIVSFHPIIFSGLKKINGGDYVQRAVLKAIKNDIAIYAIHTALDNQPHGVSKGMCDMLNLTNRKILIPAKGKLKKLITYVPAESLGAVRDALFDAGAGNIGNYDRCSFGIQGEGTFRGNAESSPTVGKPGEMKHQPETQLQVIFEGHQQRTILKALFDAHPYEEVAYDLVVLDNTYQNLGMGMTGDLPSAVPVNIFLETVREKFHAKGIRYAGPENNKIRKVAVLGGSGSFAINAAKAAGADAFITSDLKYHNYFQAGEELLLLDIGHYESEQYTKKIIADFLTKKISNFAVILAETNTNPIKYL